MLPITGIGSFCVGTSEVLMMTGSGMLSKVKSMNLVVTYYVCRRPRGRFVISSLSRISAPREWMTLFFSPLLETQEVVSLLGIARSSMVSWFFKTTFLSQLNSLAICLVKIGFLPTFMPPALLRVNSAF
jgi:hypothetical protein